MKGEDDAHERARYFRTPAAFRAWLARNHARTTVLWVGYYKKGSRRPSMTWPESVDEALCFGWIDGVRRRVDEDRYAIRFTPRKPGSRWSQVNLRRVRALIEGGRIHPAGRAAYDRRKDEPAGYSFEQRHAASLDPESERRFRGNTRAWDYFQSRPQWYRRTSIHWVMSAKRQATRDRRLATLIADSVAQRPIGPLTRPANARKSK